MTPLETIEIPAGSHHEAIAAVARQHVMGNEICLTLRLIAIDLDENVTDHVLSASHPLQHLHHPRNEIGRRALESSMIVGGVGMKNLTHQISVAAIDRARELVDQFDAILLVQQPRESGIGCGYSSVSGVARIMGGTRADAGQAAIQRPVP